MSFITLWGTCIEFANTNLIRRVFRTEYMESDHHYRNSYVEIAAAAVNAGTCLEDGDSYDKNVFDTLEDAVNQVHL